MPFETPEAAETHEVVGLSTHAINRSETRDVEEDGQRPHEICRSETREVVEGGSGTRRLHGELHTRTRAEEKGEDDTSGEVHESQIESRVFKSVVSGDRGIACRKKKALPVQEVEHEEESSDPNLETTLIHVQLLEGELTKSADLELQRLNYLRHGFHRQQEC